MRYLLIFAILTLSLNASAWPSKALGGGEKLFYDEAKFNQIRQRIDSHKWAKDLYEKLKGDIENDSRQARPTDYDQRWYRVTWTKDAAMYYRISGDERYIDQTVKNIVDYFNLDTPQKSLFDPKKTRNPNFWQWGWYAVVSAAAYDMIKEHPKMKPYTEIMNRRIKEVIEEGYRYGDNIVRLGNTQFWGMTTLGIFGFMASDEQAVSEAIDGKWGFKAVLSRFRDGGRFWPEPLHYVYGYVDCCMLLLAETARANGYKEDLYQYEAQNGASMKKMYNAFFSSITPNGHGFGNGDHGEFPFLVGDKMYIEGTPVLHNNVAAYRTNIKLDIYNYVYRDPALAWAVNRNPKRDDRCMVFWGYAALTYGTDNKNAVAPAAKSELFPEMGNAFIKSVEGANYWDSGSLNVHMRNGASQQFHSNNDHFNITINAFDKNIYNDWFLRWDYLCPRPGRANATPMTQRIINHNTVTVDCKEPDHSLVNYPQKSPERADATFSPIKRSAQMQIISCSGEIYQGVAQKRTIGVTEQYVIDIFEMKSSQPHTYDYNLHALGQASYSGVGQWSDYAVLRDEYKLGVIDGKSTQKPNNQWLTDTRAAEGKSDIKIDFIDSDNIGGYTTILHQEGTQVISTKLPFFISTEGWDKTTDSQLRPMSIVRRKAASTVFYAMHQPYKGSREVLSFEKQGDKLVVRGDKFVDTYDIKTQTFTRKLK